MVGKGLGLANTVIMLCVLCFSGLAQGAVQVPLYEERIVVSSNADQRELNTAIRQGLERVFVRVSGSTNILNESAVKEALTRSQGFVAASRFATSDQFFTNILGERIPTKTMVLTYDRKQIEEMLVRNRLPVWRDFRPEVVVWLADRVEGADRLSGDSDGHSMVTALRQASQQRGVPIVLPLMDLEDTLNITFADVYGLFSSDIENASQRYEPDAILAGRVNKVGDKYQADWLFLFKGERLRLPTVEGTEQDVINAAVNLAAQRLTQQYAFVFDPSLIGTYSLVVDNIETLQQLADIERYLKSINLITNVTLRNLANESVAFDLQISGDRTQLVDVFELDKSLAPTEEFSFETQMDRQLLYSWLR